MNIGGRLLMRHQPPDRDSRGPRGGGSGLRAAVVAGVGFTVLVGGAMIAWESESFAKWFLPAAAVAILLGVVVHAVGSRHATDGRGAAWLGHRITSAEPMAIALGFLAVTLFVCWQVLGHHWGWPLVFTGRRRLRWRWWQMLGGP